MYRANSTPIEGDREGNETGTESSAQQVSFNQESHSPQMVERKREGKKEEEEKGKRRKTASIKKRQKHFRVNATPMTYYSCHIFDRRNELSTILESKRIFQQFMMDIYSRFERKRLSYLPQNQNRLSAANYTSLKEHLSYTGAAVDEGKHWRVGRLFALYNLCRRG